MKKALVALALLAVGVAAGLGVAVLVLNDDDEGTRTQAASSTSEATGTTETTPGGRCNHADTSGCVPGSEIVITDSQWRCRGPLAHYAEEAGGTLPLKVTARFTTYVNTSGPVIDLREGCRGDGTDAIDLILDVQGDGRTRGGVNDALSVKLNAQDLDITGNLNCGPRFAISHQDGVQAQGARRIAFVDLEVGDWDKQRATCTGASGGLDISMGGIAEFVPTDYQCIRCRVIACRRGLNLGISRGVRIVDSRFRSGNPADREARLATDVVGVCSYQVSTCNIEPTAKEHVLEGNVCDEYPYEQLSSSAASQGRPASAGS
jgi:hypothetical protein